MRISPLLALALAGCTNATDTIRTLESSGYTDIQVGGYSWFECGDGDTFHTEFKARNPAGNMVSGTVCCGITKGCTVRF